MKRQLTRLAAVGAVTAAVKADNKAQIDQLSAERGKLIGQLTTTRTEAMARFYHELTPQQRAKGDQIHQRLEALYRSACGGIALSARIAERFQLLASWAGLTMCG
ncbi:MAG: hypothetical protein ABSG03_21005 [Bryobacteraceae bacterium]|jgi:Spy/CpxP family protein refolding chaperone